MLYCQHLRLYFLFVCVLVGWGSIPWLGKTARDLPPCLYDNGGDEDSHSDDINHNDLPEISTLRSWKHFMFKVIQSKVLFKSRILNRKYDQEYICIICVPLMYNHSCLDNYILYTIIYGLDALHYRKIMQNFAIHCIHIYNVFVWKYLREK
jgi:hypothetical protein